MRTGIMGQVREGRVDEDAYLKKQVIQPIIVHGAIGIIHPHGGRHDVVLRAQVIIGLCMRDPKRERKEKEKGGVDYQAAPLHLRVTSESN
jgi:hypothetical protein